MTNEQLVSKVWNYAHVLRDQGISYGDYIEQITYLLFLKMDQEREELLGETSAIPPKWSWAQIANKDGDELELQYRHTLEALGREDGLIGTIFRKAQNKLSGPCQAEARRQPDRQGGTLGRPVGRRQGRDLRRAARTQRLGGEVRRRAIFHAAPGDRGHRQMRRPEDRRNGVRPRLRHGRLPTGRL